MWKLLSSRIRFHIISANSILLLNALNREKIILEDVIVINDLELEITVYNRDIDAFLMICSKMEASAKVLRKNGLLWEFNIILKRPVLMGMLCVLTILFCYLPSRVLFVSVTGNKNITTRWMGNAYIFYNICK